MDFVPSELKPFGDHTHRGSEIRFGVEFRGQAGCTAVVENGMTYPAAKEFINSSCHQGLTPRALSRVR
jgi:hypothetical protein